MVDKEHIQLYTSKKNVNTLINFYLFHQIFSEIRITVQSYFPSLGVATILDTYKEMAFYNYNKKHYGPHIQQKLNNLSKLIERRAQ